MKQTHKEYKWRVWTNELKSLFLWFFGTLSWNVSLNDEISLHHFLSPSDFYWNLFILFSIILIHSRCSLSLCWLTITSCGKGLGEVLVCVCKWNMHMCVCLFVHMFMRCVCVRACVRAVGGFVFLCRRVFPECGGSERHFGYILMGHTGPFSCTCGYTSAHTHKRTAVGLYCI